MIKSELIQKLSRRIAHLPEKDVYTSVKLILEKMSDTLSNGGRIEIRGFGSFSLHYRPPRRAHNPRTGARVMTEAKYSPHFKPGKEMRERVNASRLNVPIQEDNRPDEEDE